MDIIGQDVNINPEGVMATYSEDGEGEWLGSDNGETYCESVNKLVKQLKIQTEANPSDEQLAKYPILAKKIGGKNRFLGESVAMKYLIEADNNAYVAWDKLRMHRCTYAGLREADRNAEHYLYALNEVRNNSYKWGVMHAATTGYGVYKGTANVFGALDEMQTGKNPSPFKGSPVTIDEFLAGHLGAQDGLYGIRD